MLAAKAALLSGDIETASKVLDGHNGGNFEDGNDSDLLEVKAIWNRATKALANLEKAQKIGDEPGKEAEVSKLIHEAASGYPELPYMSILVNRADAGVAFVNKDYDRFVQLAEIDWDICTPRARRQGFPAHWHASMPRPETQRSGNGPRKC